MRLVAPLALALLGWRAALGAAEEVSLRAELESQLAAVPALTGCCATQDTPSRPLACAANGLSLVVQLGSFKACCSGPATHDCVSRNGVYSGTVVNGGSPYQCSMLAAGQPSCGSVFAPQAGGCRVPSGVECPRNPAFSSYVSASMGNYTSCCYEEDLDTWKHTCYSDGSGTFTCGSNADVTCSAVPLCLGSTLSTLSPTSPTTNGGAWFAPNVLVALGVLLAALA
jgi:hypothetical protein